MNKINNNISFSGIKNIGYVPIREHSRSKCLSMVLKDDFNGKDLTEFRDAVNRFIASQPQEEDCFVYSGFDFVHPFSADVVNIECFFDLESKEFKTLFINGCQLDLKDVNLPFYSFVSKITKKIASMKDQDMIVNRDYKEFAARHTLIFDRNIFDKMYMSCGKSELVERCFDKERVRKGANRINNYIQREIYKYFGMD